MENSNNRYKFRAWNKYDNKIDYHLEDVPCKSFSGFENIMQFTGLYDLTGKEIYCGDIFKDDKWWVGRAVVEFENGMFGWWTDNKEEFISLFDCKNIEIIGNIYEHSHLLNQ